MRPAEIEATRLPRFVVLPALVVLSAVGSGCLSPTDITLDVTSDLPCSKLLGVSIVAGPHGTVEARQAANAVAMMCAERDGGASFGTLVLTPSSSPDTEITVRAVAGVSPTDPTTCNEENDYDGCIVVRRTLHYEDHTELTLPIELNASCSEVRCVGEDSTCVEGVCLPSKIDDPSRCVGDGCTQAKLFDGVKSPGCLADQDFAALGTLPGIADSLLATISSDGRVVFGYSSTIAKDGGGDPAHARPFRCASFGERTPIRGPEGRPFLPHACDTSGNVLVGSDVTHGTTSAVRWSDGKAVALLSIDFSSEVLGCDRGSCTKLVGDLNGDAVAWASPSKQPLVLRADGGGAAGYADGIDPSGRFAVGNWYFQAGFWDVVENTFSAVGVQAENSNVNQATPDGATLVGYSTHHSVFGAAFLWKAVEPWKTYEPTKLLPVPAPNDNCAVLSVSDDGTVLTGLCGPNGKSVAAVWEAKSNFAPEVLAERIAAPSGWSLLNALVSADGTIVAGSALNGQHQREVYVARLK